MDSSLSLIFNTLLDGLVDLFDVIFFCGVFVEVRWIVDLWSYYSWMLIESSPNFILHNCYSFVFLSDLTVWFGQLDWFILQWERFYVMGSVLQCSIPVKERDMKHICIISIKDKTMVFIHIGWVYFVYIMSSCLTCYSVLYELDTLDAC